MVAIVFGVWFELPNNGFSFSIFQIFGILKPQVFHSQKGLSIVCKFDLFLSTRTGSKNKTLRHEVCSPTPAQVALVPPAADEEFVQGRLECALFTLCLPLVPLVLFLATRHRILVPSLLNARTLLRCAVA